jgi:hypothetical protein
MVGSQAGAWEPERWQEIGNQDKRRDALGFGFRRPAGPALQEKASSRHQKHSQTKLSKKKLAFHAPGGALGAILQQDAGLDELLADGVGFGEIFVLPGLAASLD